jgi:hypothetical protein
MAEIPAEGLELKLNGSEELRGCEIQAEGMRKELRG